MSNNLKLDEMLNEYKVGELKELAKLSGVTGYSKLKKAELVDVVANQLMTVDADTLDIPEEIKAVLVPKKEEKAAEKVSSKTTATANKTHSASPIIGVAPHVINVMSENQVTKAPISNQFSHSGKKIYPNDPCPCGSGKKYKKCCGRR